MTIWLGGFGVAAHWNFVGLADFEFVGFGIIYFLGCLVAGMVGGWWLCLRFVDEMCCW